MKKVVILGAGFAGLHIFYKLRDLMGREIEITIIDKNDYSLLKPSLPEVALEGASVSHVQIPIANTLRAKGATFLQSNIKRIDADKKEIYCENNKVVLYDTLFITLGAVKDYDAIEGYREHGYSVCDDEQAQRLWERLQTFKGGHIVAGTAQSHFGTRVDAPKLMAPCEGPIGEVMFMIDHHLKEEGIAKENYSINVFSPAKEFFEDVGEKPHEVVGKIMEEQGILLHTDKQIEKLDATNIYFTDGTSLPCDLAILIPPYKAPPAIVRSGIGDEEGYLPTDEEMRHLDYPDILVAGDISALAQPKLGHIAILQAAIAVASFRKELGHDIEIPKYEPNVFCIMNMGGSEAIMINDDTLYGGSTSVALHSPVSKVMKWGFDNYLYFNKGHMPPDWALKLTDKLTEIL